MCYIIYLYNLFFFFKQKTAYEMRISDWSSGVCSSDLQDAGDLRHVAEGGDQVVVQVLRATRQVLFHQREAEALGDAAMDLALHQRRVHRAADVVGSGHAQHLHRAEVEIDRHLGDLRGKAVDRKSTRLNSSH